MMQVTINKRMDSIKEHLAEALVWVLALIAPSFVSMGILMILIIGDFITGIWASVHRGGWQSINSTEMARSISKIFLYYIAIITGIACSHAVPYVPFDKVAVGFIAMVELKSVYENIGAVTGIDLWAQIRRYLDSKKDR